MPDRGEYGDRPSGPEGHGESGAAPPPSRPLWIVVLLLSLAAAALWGASGLTWIDVPRGTTVEGRVVRGDLSGADLLSWPVPLAVFALAAVAAALALRGTARRVLGVVLLLVGGLVLYLTVNGSAYEVAWTGRAPGFGDRQDSPTRTIWGPAVAILGGLLLASAGGLLTWRGHRMPRMGARYSAPGGAAGRRRDTETGLWDALSEGDDPTTRER